jgi:hypothetical protein
MSEQAVVESNGKKAKVPTVYKVLLLTDQNTWAEWSEEKAIGPDDARKKAVMDSPDLQARVEDGNLTLVAVSARFWVPKSPKIKTSTAYDFS